MFGNVWNGRAFQTLSLDSGRIGFPVQGSEPVRPSALLCTDLWKVDVVVKCAGIVLFSMSSCEFHLFAFPNMIETENSIWLLSKHCKSLGSSAIKYSFQFLD